MAGVSGFSENGLALPTRPSSSQKKKRRSQQQQHWSYVVRKSVTRKKKRSSPNIEEAMRGYRSQLRPLLDAIRFVESSNRADCPDGDGGASIGPLQISKNYHLDAWRNKRTSWLRCRELEHAENTVVAYWMRYCSQALSQHDWEILAKIHNGGPQGPQRAKTSYYWSKVCRYLEENHIPSTSLSPAHKSHPSTSSKFTNFERRTEYKLIKHGLKTLAPERRMPIVKSRLHARRAPFMDISSAVLNVRHMDDLNIQRLGLANSYSNLESVIQLDSENQRGRESSNHGDECFTTPRPTKAQQAKGDRYSENEGNVEFQRASTGSRNLDMLYSSELSEQKEEEIFAELARLLPLDLSECVERIDDESFEFPPVPIQADYTTPILKPDNRALQLTVDNESASDVQPSESLVFDATDTLLEEQSCSPLPSFEDKSLLSELADLLDLPHPATTTPQVHKEEEEELERPTVQLSLADFLLEIPDPSASIEYVKALFSCEDVLLESLCDRGESLEESSDSSNPAPTPAPAPAPAPAGSIGTRESRIGSSVSGGCTCHSGGNRSASSLKRLCAVWEEQDVDLLTRSLRFKMLTTRSELPASEAPCIAWEIQALQNINRSAKSRRTAKELIQQQREKIYTNIGAYASRNERLQLYSVWGVRKLSTGRLKGIVYDLLWKDPKRYSLSTELVSLYL